MSSTSSEELIAKDKSSVQNNHHERKSKPPADKNTAVEKYISEASSQTNTNTRSSSCPDDRSEHYARLLEESRQTASNRDVLIGMLHKQLKKMEDIYKKALDQQQDLRLKFANVVQELSQVKIICNKLKEDNCHLLCENEKNVIRYTAERKVLKTEVDQWRTEYDQLLKAIENMEKNTGRMKTLLEENNVLKKDEPVNSQTMGRLIEYYTNIQKALTQQNEKLDNFLENFDVVGDGGCTLIKSLEGIKCVNKQLSKSLNSIVEQQTGQKQKSQVSVTDCCKDELILRQQQSKLSLKTEEILQQPDCCKEQNEQLEQQKAVVSNANEISPEQPDRCSDEVKPYSCTTAKEIPQLQQIAISSTEQPNYGKEQNEQLERQISTQSNANETPTEQQMPAEEPDCFKAEVKSRLQQSQPSSMTEFSTEQPNYGKEQIEQLERQISTQSNANETPTEQQMPVEEPDCCKAKVKSRLQQSQPSSMTESLSCDEKTFQEQKEPVPPQMPVPSIGNQCWSQKSSMSDYSSYSDEVSQQQPEKAVLVATGQPGSSEEQNKPQQQQSTQSFNAKEIQPSQENLPQQQQESLPEIFAQCCTEHQEKEPQQQESKECCEEKSQRKKHKQHEQPEKPLKSTKENLDPTPPPEQQAKPKVEFLTPPVIERPNRCNCLTKAEYWRWKLAQLQCQNTTTPSVHQKTPQQQSSYEELPQQRPVPMPLVIERTNFCKCSSKTECWNWKLAQMQSAKSSKSTCSSCYHDLPLHHHHPKPCGQETENTQKQQSNDVWTSTDKEQVSPFFEHSKYPSRVKSCHEYCCEKQEHESHHHHSNQSAKPEESGKDHPYQKQMKKLLKSALSNYPQLGEYYQYIKPLEQKTHLLQDNQAKIKKQLNNWSALGCWPTTTENKPPPKKDNEHANCTEKQRWLDNSCEEILYLYNPCEETQCTQNVEWCYEEQPLRQQAPISIDCCKERVFQIGEAQQLVLQPKQSSTPECLACNQSLSPKPAAPVAATTEYLDCCSNHDKRMIEPQTRSLKQLSNPQWYSRETPQQEQEGKLVKRNAEQPDPKPSEPQFCTRDQQQEPAVNFVQCDQKTLPKQPEIARSSQQQQINTADKEGLPQQQQEASAAAIDEFKPQKRSDEQSSQYCPEKDRKELEKCCKTTSTDENLNGNKNLVEENDQLRIRIDEMTRELELLRKHPTAEAHENVVTENNGLQTENNKLRKITQELLEEMKGVKGDLEQKINELDAINTANEETITQNNNLLKEHETNLDKANAKYATVLKEVKKLTETNRELSEKINMLEESIKQHKELAGPCKARLDDLSQKNAALENTLREVREESQRKESECSDKLATSKAALTKLNAKYEKLKSNYKSLEEDIKELDLLKKKNSNLIRELDQRDVMITELHKQIEDLGKELNAVRQEILENSEKATEQMHGLICSCNKLEEELENTQEILENQNNSVDHEVNTSDHCCAIENVNGSIDALQTELQEKTNETQKLLQELDEVRTEFEDKLQELRDKNELLQSQLEKQQTEYQKEIDLYEQKLAQKFDTSTNAGESQTEGETLPNVGELEAQLEEAREQNKILKEELTSTKEELKNLKEMGSKFGKLKVENIQLKSKTCDLQKQLNSLKDLEESMKKLRQENLDMIVKVQYLENELTAARNNKDKVKKDCVAVSPNTALVCKCHDPKHQLTANATILYDNKKFDKCCNTDSLSTLDSVPSPTNLNVLQFRMTNVNQMEKQVAQMIVTVRQQNQRLMACNTFRLRNEEDIANRLHQLKHKRDDLIQNLTKFQQEMKEMQKESVPPLQSKKRTCHCKKQR